VRREGGCTPFSAGSGESRTLVIPESGSIWSRSINQRTCEGGSVQDESGLEIDPGRSSVLLFLVPRRWRASGSTGARTNLGPEAEAVPHGVVTPDHERFGTYHE
jgi:hypothetical protein